jgi:hypothetical protein
MVEAQVEEYLLAHQRYLEQRTQAVEVELEGLLVVLVAQEL